MCGLIAAQLAQPWLNQEKLDRALGTIVHRGPDGSASWFSDDRLTVMGHVRLSIIGLDNGEQPLSHDRGDLHAVVNGEFYGYRHIREELRKRGYRFRTDSDSEIALHLYDEFGLDFVDHLRGEYAFVLSDRRSGELIAVRDRFGIKPLYYAAINGEVLFASEIKALLALGVPARWDPQSVMSELTFLRGGSSMFLNIRQVPPGCLLIARNGAVEIRQYWENAYPKMTELVKDTRSEAEIVSGFRGVLEDAVSERLVADVEVACYLSGGLDSSAVLGVAQAQLDRPIRAFTIAFEGAFDESPLAERTAAFTNSNYVPIPVTAQDLADNLDDAIWHCEKPIFNGNSVAKFMLSRAVRDAGIKVVFTGEGSDEMLAGYAFERRDMMLYGEGYSSEDARQAAIAALIERNPLSASMMFPSGELAAGCDVIRQAIGFCPTWIESMSKQGLKLHKLMRNDVAETLSLEEPYQTLLDEFELTEKVVGRDVVNGSLYAWQKTALVNFILTVLADRMEMAHSIEGRVPFLDHKVAEYAAGLPIQYKIREETEKYVLREATKDVITQELYERQKHPFIAPPMQKTRNNRMSDPLLQRCEDIIRSPAFDDQPFFDPVKARDLIDSLVTMDDTLVGETSPIIQRMATLSLMQQRFGISS